MMRVKPRKSTQPYRKRPARPPSATLAMMQRGKAMHGPSPTPPGTPVGRKRRKRRRRGQP